MSVTPSSAGQARPRRWERTSLSALQHRDFRRFWLAALVSNSGNWMQQIAVPFVIFQITGSNTWLGVAAFVGLIPAVPMSPIAGVIADRFDRRRIIVVTQSVQLVSALVLWGLWVTGEVTPVRIVAVLAVSGTVAGLQIASWQSLVPLLVPRDSLIAAVQLNSAQFTASRAFGPALGGIVLGVFGPGGAFLGNAVTYLFTIVAVTTARPREVPPGDRTVTIRRQFADGVRYVRQRSALLLAVLSGAAISVFGQSVVFLGAGLAEDVFLVDERGLGVLTAAVGLGSIVASSVIIGRGDRSRRSRMAAVGFIFYCTGLFVVAATTVFPVGLVGFFLMGMAHIMVAISMNTSIQLHVAESMRGRVMSIYTMSIFAGIPVGSLILGRMGDVIGLRPTVAVAGTCLSLVSLGAWLGFERFRGLDAEHDVVRPGTPVPF